MPLSVYHPVPVHDYCAKCGVNNPSIPCPACLSRSYCSNECQFSDRSHPLKQGLCPRDKLELGKFYPFIAWAAELTRLEHVSGQPALWNEITDAPTQDCIGLRCARNGGSLSTVIRYGRTLKRVYSTDPLSGTQNRKSAPLVPSRPPPEDPPSESATEVQKPAPLSQWWPGCESVEQRSYLRRRISRDGHLLPLVFGMGVAILLELFTHPPLGSPPLLHFLGNAIMDFGVCRGTLSIEPQRILTYIDDSDSSEGIPKNYQHPNEHFWLYFRTEGEETLYLDIGLFVYGYRYHIVNADLYLPRAEYRKTRSILQDLLEIPQESMTYLDPYAAAHFSNKAMRRQMRDQGLICHQTVERFSILRDNDLLCAIDRMDRVLDLEKKSPFRFKQDTIIALTKFLLKADKHSQMLGDLDTELLILLDTIVNGTRIVGSALANGTATQVSNPYVEDCKWEFGLSTSRWNRNR